MSVRSMTGYAQVRRQGAWGEITATVKSVNHRALDLHTYLPLEFESLDPALRQVVRKSISRGHVELRLSYRPAENTAGPALNRALFDSYLRALKQASDICGVLADPDPNRALRIPGMLAQSEAAALPPEVEAEAVKAAEEALEALNRFRTREGAETATAMLGHNALVRQNAEAIRSLRGEVAESSAPASTSVSPSCSMACRWSPSGWRRKWRIWSTAATSPRKWTVSTRTCGNWTNCSARGENWVRSWISCSRK
jgi:uncharacterized protein (TIGR00255 family)